VKSREPGGWVALEEASSAFERPSWAIRALLEQGKLERKVEDGRIYVRARAEERAPAASPVAAADDLEGLASELADTLEQEPATVTALALEPALSRAPLVDLRDAALWSEVAANLADLAHAARARDALLARTAEALRAVEAAAERPAPEPPRPARAPVALVLVLVVVALGAFAAARIETESAAAVRAEAELSLRRAELLESRRSEQTVAPAPVGSSAGTTLAASLPR
jgi:hypothetical protein